MSKKGYQGGSRSNSGASGGSVIVENVSDPAILECLAELKLLTAANNDAVALATLISEMEAVCEKLLANGETQAQQSETLAEMLESLTALCEKIESGNAEQLACLEQIKASAAEIESKLDSACEKLEAANVIHTAALDESVDQGLTLDSILSCNEELKELLTCPPAVALGVISTWG